jgi:prepilin-type N-terminal cleavage/methylation domain-containing protein
MVWLMNQVHKVPHDKRQTGFSVAEIMVVVAILGIASAIAIPSFAFVLRRERVNAVALETAAWLERVRSLSARQVDTGVDATAAGAVNYTPGGGCAIILGGPRTAAATGDAIAAVEGCVVPDPVLLLPDTQGQTFAIQTFGLAARPAAVGQDAPICPPALGSACAGSVGLFFTPRGTWSSDSVGDQDFEIRIALSDGQGPKRCVRVSEIMGSIDIGTSQNGALGTACTSYAAI